MARDAKGEGLSPSALRICYRHLVLMAVFLGVQASIVQPAFGGPVPDQFIGRLYTEALGRAPDQGGWTSHTDSAFWQTCNASRLRDKAQEFYGGTEYWGSLGGPGPATTSRSEQGSSHSIVACWRASQTQPAWSGI